MIPARLLLAIAGALDGMAAALPIRAEAWAGAALLAAGAGEADG